MRGWECDLILLLTENGVNDDMSTTREMTLLPGEPVLIAELDFQGEQAHINDGTRIQVPGPAILTVEAHNIPDDGKLKIFVRLTLKGATNS